MLCVKSVSCLCQKKQAKNPNKTRPWSGPYAAYKRTQGKARNATQTPLTYPSCPPLSPWRSQLSTLVKYTRKLHAKVAKSRKVSAKMTATAANRNKRQQKLRQNSCAVAFFLAAAAAAAASVAVAGSVPVSLSVVKPVAVSRNGQLVTRQAAAARRSRSGTNWGRRQHVASVAGQQYYITGHKSRATQKKDKRKTLDSTGR